MSRRIQAPNLAPEAVAELQRLRQNIAVVIANADQAAQHYRRIDAGLCKSLAALGYGEAEDSMADVRLVQGLDDVRGELEAAVTRLAALETAVATMARLWGHGPLVSEGFVIQANEELRRLRRDIHAAPQATATATAAAVGAVLAGRPLVVVPRADGGGDDGADLERAA
jgi:hypothetical protein